MIVPRNQLARNRQPTLAQQLYQLYRVGNMTYKVYQKLKKASPAAQRKAVSKASGTTRRRADIKDVKESVRIIQHRLNNDLSTHTHRRIDAGVISSGNQLQAMEDEQLGHATSYLSSAISGLRYYDPSNPATLLTVDADSGTFSRKLSVKNVHCEYHFRNNYQVPANMVIYECAVKLDTNIAPSTSVTQGLTDQMSSYPGNTTPFVFPTDSDQFRSLWNIKKTTKVHLEPGRTYKYKYNSGPFEYDPSFVDSHSLTYQKHFKSRILLIKLIGDVAHDSVLGQYGFCASSVDYVRLITTDIEYESGGVSLRDFSFDNNISASFTNGAVLSNKPVSDNQGYSQA